jgi:hypothetical protein
LDLDDRLRLLEAPTQPLDLPLQALVLARGGVARLALGAAATPQGAQGALPTGTPPLGQVRGVQPLAPEQGAQLAGRAARVGASLLDEANSFGKTPPSFEDLAKYIWFTDTSQPFSLKQVKKKTGHIGTWRGTSYYLLYSPDGKGRTALDREFLKGLEDDAAKKVVYCEKVWIHRDELREFGHIVPMVLPFHLK